MLRKSCFFVVWIRHLSHSHRNRGISKTLATDTRIVVLIPFVTDSKFQPQRFSHKKHVFSKVQHFPLFTSKERRSRNFRETTDGRDSRDGQEKVAVLVEGHGDDFDLNEMEERERRLDERMQKKREGEKGGGLGLVM